MKITEYDIIKSGEQELIDAITADLDWGTIDNIFSKGHNLKIDENVEYRNGDIVVHNDQIAYKLEFNVNVILSVLLDREGNYISVTSSGDLNNLEDKTEDDLPDEGEISEKEAEDSYETALSELDSTTTSDIEEESSPVSNEENPQDKISKIASQAEEMISEIEHE
jgi:hypothetical protein